MPYVATRVAANERLQSGYFVLRIAECHHLRNATPGQFVMLRGDWGCDPLLPRAFSLLRTHPTGEAEILCKTVGKASARLEQTPPGAPIFVLGPLGVGFSAPDPARRDLLVAGGVGLAPLLLHAERYAKRAPVELLYGARSQRDLVLLDDCTRSGAALYLATEDGTAGDMGRVTLLLERRLQDDPRPARVLACGPNPMLDAVRRIAEAHETPCFVSLEGEMACGIGACLGCAVAARSKPYRYVCKDGPVFDTSDLAP